MLMRLGVLVIVSFLSMQGAAGAMAPGEGAAEQEDRAERRDVATPSWWQQFLAWLDEGSESTADLWNRYEGRGVRVCRICMVNEVKKTNICAACHKEIEQRQREYDELDRWLVGRF